MPTCGGCTSAKGSPFNRLFNILPAIAGDAARGNRALTPRRYPLP
jgi:hypothetical protein